jgi:hypothetical protein
LHGQLIPFLSSIGRTVPVAWCAISSHGLGHAAQAVPVLNELGRAVPNLRVMLRTQVPAWFFQDRLAVDWTLSPAQQDIGCVQRGPLQIDVATTWEAHARFHADWSRTLDGEVRAITTARPDIVLSDISYLAIQAGKRTGVPTVGFGNLSWDQILEPLATPGDVAQQEILAHIRQAYAHVDLMIRVAPGLSLPAFPKIADVGPIGDPRTPEPDALRRAVGATPDERVVLIAFGGIALTSLPFERLEQMTGYRFIVAGFVPQSSARCHAADSTPLSFRTLLASADLIVTKPGYSTVIEAVALGKPIVYVRRYNFADEQALVDYLHRHGRGAELSAADFAEGRWRTALATAESAPTSAHPAPPATGAAEAAHLLARYLP